VCRLVDQIQIHLSGVCRQDRLKRRKIGSQQARSSAIDMLSAGLSAFLLDTISTRLRSIILGKSLGAIDRKACLM
jgi:hypothetical protein